MHRYIPPKDFGVLARVQPPDNPNNPSEVLTYRRNLARRSLRSQLTRNREGRYSHINSYSIVEILWPMVKASEGIEGRWDQPRWEATVDALERLGRILLRRDLPQLSQRQIDRFVGVSQGQVDALAEAIALGTWDLNVASINSDAIARDATIRNRIEEVAQGVHTTPITRLTLFGDGDIAALDYALCTSMQTAAIEQTLKVEVPPPDNLRYAYEKDNYRFYYAHVYSPADVSACLPTISAHGFQAQYLSMLPLSAEQLLRIARR